MKREEYRAKEIYKESICRINKSEMARNNNSSWKINYWQSTSLRHSEGKQSLRQWGKHGRWGLDLLEAEQVGEWAFRALFRFLLEFWFWLQSRNCLDMLIWKCVSTDKWWRGTCTFFLEECPWDKDPIALEAGKFSLSNLFPGIDTKLPSPTTRWFSVLCRKWFSVLLLNVNSDLLISGQALGCFFYNQNLIHRTGLRRKKIWFC